MSKEKNNSGLIFFLILMVVLAIIVFAIIIYIRNKKKAAAGKESITSDIPPTTPEPTWPLRYGSEGPYVKQLQKNINAVIFWMDKYHVNNYGLEMLDTDGEWGGNTNNAVTLMSTHVTGHAISQIEDVNQYNAIAAQMRTFVDNLKASHSNIPDETGNGFDWNILYNPFALLF